MNQKRQPKGTRDGGKFAPDVNAESTVDLAPDCGRMVSIGDPVRRDGAIGVVVDVQPAVMYPSGEPTVDVQVDFSGTSKDPDFEPSDSPWFDRSELETFSGDGSDDGDHVLELECSQCGSESTFTTQDAATSAGWQSKGDVTCAHCADILRHRTTPTPLQNANLELAALRKDREENPSLDEIVVARATDRLSELDDLDYDQSVTTDPASLADDYKRYSLGMHDRDFDGAFEGIDYVVEQFIDWRVMDKAERVGHEGPFQVGSVLEYDVEVVPWVPSMHEENVAVQVWMKEGGDADNDCAGWEPRAIAQIARERGLTNVTNRDLQDILDDPDIDKIAFRPDTSIRELLVQVNALNAKDAK